MLKHISYYIQKYPARLSGYVSAIILNASKMWSDFPVSMLIPVAMILIIFGEGSQRMEDNKTIRALYTENDHKKSDGEILADIFKDSQGMKG